MHLVILLLAALAFFLYLTLRVVKGHGNRKFFYLFLLVDLWLASVFVYLVIDAVVE